MTSPPSPHCEESGSGSVAHPGAVVVRNILDSVCVLYFSTSGQIHLWVNILTAAGYRILITPEVLEEVRRKATQRRWNISGLDAHLGHGDDSRIRVIPQITVAQPEALILLGQVRRRYPNGAAGPHQRARQPGRPDHAPS